MIKISATLAKKVPIEGLAYSSQSFGATMEIEISDADRPDAIKARIQELYSLLAQTIDEQIGATQSAPQQVNAGTANTLPQQRRLNSPAPNPAQAQNGSGRRTPYANVARNGKPVGATQAQQRAIFAICSSLGLDMAAVLADYNVSDPAQLTVKDASHLIDQLKSRQNGAA